MLSAILRTLAYADIFDYPLTAKEIHHWLIWQSKSSSPSKSSTLLSLQKSHPQILKQGKYYTLKDRQHLTRLRRKRHKPSQQKLKIATRVGGWLKIIPWIKMVGVTGALAMSNADLSDDIDLFIITHRNQLWLSRFACVSLTEILGVRRRPLPHQSASVSDKICLNLFLDETSLAIPPKNRNLYTAHEVAQVKLLWGRENTYQRFLFANSWVNKFLPNIKMPKTSKVKLTIKQSNHLAIFENIVFNLQFHYMKPKITKEVIGRHFAFFHPKNHKQTILTKYHSRLKSLNIS